MQQKLNEEKVFKDPVHNYVHVGDPVIWQLINTPEFQRLRRIRQLGTSYLTFHGAEHSRFSHSLGVYEITRRIILQFEQSGYTDWPKEEKLVALCAALLHDVGHGPFSHSIEEAFDMDHEEWTCKIILGDTEIREILKRVSPDFPEKVAAVIAKTYDKPIVVNLVSSPLDADRMDYLLRDAYYTGVNYGTIDLDRILRVLRPYHGRVVVKDSGMHAVEDYLMSRYQMYWQVYFHPVTRSSEIILRQIFKRAKELVLSGYSFKFMLPSLCSLIKGDITVKEYLRIDESIIQAAFNQWTEEEDEQLRDLCIRFLDRKLYKYVEVDRMEEDEINEMKQAFLEAGLDPDYDLEIDFPSDLPYDVFRPDDEDSQKQIIIIDKQERLRDIFEVSDIVRSISGIQRGKYHLYFPQEKVKPCLEKLPPHIQKIFS